MVTCKVTQLPLKDCDHCKAICSKFRVPVGQCAHCNVSTFDPNRVHVVKGHRPTAKVKIDRSITFRLSGEINGVMTFIDPNDHPIPELFQDTLYQDPSKSQCSYCGKTFPKVEMTEGISKINKSIKVEVNPVTNVLDETITHYPTKVKACRECAHLIKPLLDREGKIKHPGVKRGPIND